MFLAAIWRVYLVKLNNFFNDLLKIWRKKNGSVFKIFKSLYKLK